MGAYRAAEEKQRCGDIGRMKLFRLQLGVSEEYANPPSGADEWELHITLTTPAGPRRVHQVFAWDGERWWITYSEETPLAN